MQRLLVDVFVAYIRFLCFRAMQHRNNRKCAYKSLRYKMCRTDLNNGQDKPHLTPDITFSPSFFYSPFWCKMMMGKRSLKNIYATQSNAGLLDLCLIFAFLMNMFTKTLSLSLNYSNNAFGLISRGSQLKNSSFPCGQSSSLFPIQIECGAEAKTQVLPFISVGVLLFWLQRCEMQVVLKKKNTQPLAEKLSQIQLFG